MKAFGSMLVLILTAYPSFSQNGYIKFNRHQKAEGYVSVFNNAHVHEHQVEIRTSPDDRNPKRYHKKDIMEYAIKGDTFRILKKFYPYEIEEIFYELVDAKVIHAGKVSLLQVHNSYTSLDKGLFSTYHDQNPSQVEYFYVLQDEEGSYKRGVPSKKDKFRPVLLEFFSDEAVAEYEKEYGGVHFRDLEKLVKFCNARM
jgi:hypothetical protein